MSTPTFTTPPTAPARTDAKVTFVTRANAFVAWLVTFFGEMVIAVPWLANTAAEVQADATIANASAAAAIAVTDYVDTSSSSLSLSAGAKAVVLARTGDAFTNTARATLIRLSDPNSRMSGPISAANMGAGTMTVTVDSVTGSGGPFTDWLVVLSALESVTPDTAKAQAIAFAAAL